MQAVGDGVPGDIDAVAAAFVLDVKEEFLGHAGACEEGEKTEGLVVVAWDIWGLVTRGDMVGRCGVGEVGYSTHGSR